MNGCLSINDNDTIVSGEAYACTSPNINNREGTYLGVILGVYYHTTSEDKEILQIRNCGYDNTGKDWIFFSNGKDKVLTPVASIVISVV